jgi:hypothetical protein
MPFYAPTYSGFQSGTRYFHVGETFIFQDGSGFSCSCCLLRDGRGRLAVHARAKRFKGRKTSLCVANTSQIRCSGERPVCKRCSRLGHTCNYSGTRLLARSNPKPAQASSALGATDIHPSPTSIAARECIHVISCETAPGDRNATRIEAARVGRQAIANEAVHVRTSNTSSASTLLLDDPVEQDRYLGIPMALILTLVQVYYDNVYNATLLLHKKSFLQSLAAGSARPHVVLSVCAWAAKYAILAFHARGFILTEWLLAFIEIQPARVPGGITAL